MKIGYKDYTIEQWFNFTDVQIEAMDKKALAFWVKWKPVIEQIVKTLPTKQPIELSCYDSEDYTINDEPRQ